MWTSSDAERSDGSGFRMEGENPPLIHFGRNHSCACCEAGMFQIEMAVSDEEPSESAGFLAGLVAAATVAIGLIVGIAAATGSWMVAVAIFVDRAAVNREAATYAGAAIPMLVVGVAAGVVALPIFLRGRGWSLPVTALRSRRLFAMGAMAGLSVTAILMAGLSCLAGGF
jgi:hypothetical protein